MWLVQFIRGVKYLQYMALYNGVTTMSDLNFGAMTGSIQDDWAIANYTFNAPNAAPIRSIAVVGISYLQKLNTTDNGLAFLANMTKNWSTSKLMFPGSVKGFMDDAYLSLSMQMFNPGYTDGHVGLWNTIPAACSCHIGCLAHRSTFM